VSTNKTVVVSGLNLPEGVKEADWAREMGRWQNPRIRALLGCLQVLAHVLESNFAILHSSPTRVREMLDTLRQVSKTLRDDISLLMNGESVIPDLESSRLAVRANLTHIEKTILSELDSFDDQAVSERLGDLRRFLCVAVGSLHRFLQDSFGGLLASDPRASHDADYYLSKQFPRDVEEAEWLYESVIRLEDTLREFEAERRVLLTETMQRMTRERRIPTRAEWADTDAFLERLESDLAVQLREVTGLKGIRLDELDLLTHYGNEVPALTRIIAELYASNLEALACVEESLDGKCFGELQQILSERLIPLVSTLDDSLRDLGVFIPLWRRGISQRRALLLRPPEDRDSATP
jgi:hypothetical protein